MKKKGVLEVLEKIVGTVVMIAGCLNCFEIISIDFSNSAIVGFILILVGGSLIHSHNIKNEQRR